MTVIMFAVACIWAIAAAYFNAKRLDEKKARAQETRRHEYWFTKWQDEIRRNIEIEEELAALEQGTKEIEENYQQELLTEYDKVEALTNSNNYRADELKELEQTLVPIVYGHNHDCLPWLWDPSFVVRSTHNEPIYDELVLLELAGRIG